ncbi:MAG: hypothetical protein H8E32_13695 [Nitrospinae bacterium]|nr:hypothetical protein [Nitrospinota bacterium]
MKIPLPNNILKILTLLASLLFLTSCAQLFTIVPSGNTNEDVKFEFYKNDNNDETLELKVESVILERRIFNIWRQVWSIWEKGNSETPSLKHIKYKEIPIGLVEIVKPKKILVGSSYRVSVSGTLLSGETAYGIEVFHLNEYGDVIIAKGGGVIISERR